MPKTYVKLRDGSTVDADDVTLPQDRQFRDAWENVQGGVVQIDMAKAKEIVKEKLERKARPLILDQLEIKAEAEADGDTTAQANAASRIKELRNAKNDAAISNASDQAALKAAKPAGLNWMEEE